MAEETLPLGVSSCLVPLDIQPTALGEGRGSEEGKWGDVQKLNSPSYFQSVVSFLSKRQLQSLTGCFSSALQ